MPKGGSRPRSGPAPDPNSARSERARKAAAKKTATAPASSESAITTADFNATALPAKGRGGNPPAFPLPKIVRYVLSVNGDGKPVKVPNSSAGDAFRKRELEVWRAVWKTPQAVAWERDPWRWPTIAEYCRLKTVLEADPDSNAALFSRLREYRNEIGLTPDGLRMNGWAIAADQLAAKRAERTDSTKKKAAAKPAPVRRLR